MTITRIISALLALATLAAAPTHAGPFDKGSQSVSLIAGSGSSFNENYVIIGGGYGYYVLDGLELGVDAQAWLGGDPGIYKLSPKVNYVLNASPSFKPYAGIFYRRTYVDNLPDLDSVGYRAGLMFMQQRGMYFGAGVVYEDYQDCSEAVFTECSNTYPEIMFSLSF